MASTDCASHVDSGVWALQFVAVDVLDGLGRADFYFLRGAERVQLLGSQTGGKVVERGGEDERIGTYPSPHDLERPRRGSRVRAHGLVAVLRDGLDGVRGDCCVASF